MRRKNLKKNVHPYVQWFNRLRAGSRVMAGKVLTQAGTPVVAPGTMGVVVHRPSRDQIAVHFDKYLDDYMQSKPTYFPVRMDDGLLPASGIRPNPKVSVRSNPDYTLIKHPPGGGRRQRPAVQAPMSFNEYAAWRESPGVAFVGMMAEVPKMEAKHLHALIERNHPMAWMAQYELNYREELHRLRHGPKAIANPSLTQLKAEMDKAKRELDEALDYFGVGGGAGARHLRVYSDRYQEAKRRYEEAMAAAADMGNRNPKGRGRHVARDVDYKRPPHRAETDYEWMTVEGSFGPYTIDMPTSPYPYEIPPERAGTVRGWGSDAPYRGTDEHRKKHKRRQRKKGRAARGKFNPRQSDVGMYQNILAHLRALQWVYTTSHWTSAGSNSYSDHLLLQRLYEGLDKPIDALGERMVAYFGPGSVNPGLINERVQHFMKYDFHGVAEDPFYRLFHHEDSLQKAIRKAWKANQDSGDEFSLGIDDYLMGLANDRDEAIYLLKQRLGQ